MNTFFSTSSHRLGGMAFTAISMIYIRATLGIITVGSILVNFERFRSAIVVLILLQIIFDVLDGVTFNKSSLAKDKVAWYKRRVADSLVDRVFIISAAISLMVVDSGFIWLGALILVKESIIALPNIFHWIRNQVVRPPLIAKIVCLFEASAVLSYMHSEYLPTIVFSIFIIISTPFVIYFYRKGFTEKHVVKYPIN